MLPILTCLLLTISPNTPNQATSKVDKLSDRAEAAASRITIQGQGRRLSAILDELQKQSGNQISDLREAFGAEADNPTINLDIQAKPFFEALDQVTRRSGLDLNFFTGDGSIGLVPGRLERARSDDWVQVEGPFRIRLREISATRDLASGQGQASVLVEFAWEPRLRPWLLNIKSADLTIVDDRGKAVPPDVQAASITLPLQPENPVAEVRFNMVAPDREASRLQTLKAQGEVIAPSGFQRFRFPQLDAQDQTEKRDGAKVTLVSTTVDQNVWKIRLDLEMLAEGQPLESFQQGLFRNRLWLERADGSRIEHKDGFSSDPNGPGRYQFEYLFLNLPGQPSDYSLIYEAPSQIATIPFELSFENVPLP